MGIAKLSEGGGTIFEPISVELLKSDGQITEKLERALFNCLKFHPDINELSV